MAKTYWDNLELVLKDEKLIVGWAPHRWKLVLLSPLLITLFALFYNGAPQSPLFDEHMIIVSGLLLANLVYCATVIFYSSRFLPWYFIADKAGIQVRGMKSVLRWDQIKRGIVFEELQSDASSEGYSGDSLIRLDLNWLNPLMIAGTLDIELAR